MFGSGGWKFCSFLWVCGAVMLWWFVGCYGSMVVVDFGLVVVSIGWFSGFLFFIFWFGGISMVVVMVDFGRIG